MRFTFTEEQSLVARAVAEFLDKECTPEALRTGELRLFDALTRIGVPGMLAPPDAGGMGMGFGHLVSVLEEAGRTALPDPLVEHAAVAVPVLGGEWQARAAAGELVTTSFDDAPYAPDADRAALVLVQRGDALVAIERPELTAQPSVDRARRLFSVAGDGPVIDSGESVALAAARGVAGTAAVLLGVANALIERAAAYATERTQFGKPIGEFQLVKGMLADALVGVRFAAPVVYRAAHSIDAGEPTTTLDASMAKLVASEAALQAARVALQVHGAIGYTEEHDLHLWLKRAWALAGAWGTAAEHRARITAALVG